MSESARTTISMDSGLYERALKRAAALKYKSFSQYVEYLIEKDVSDRGSHISVREEPPAKKTSGSSWD